MGFSISDMLKLHSVFDMRFPENLLLTLKHFGGKTAKSPKPGSLQIYNFSSIYSSPLWIVHHPCTVVVWFSSCRSCLLQLEGDTNIAELLVLCALVNYLFTKAPIFDSDRLCIYFYENFLDNYTRIVFWISSGLSWLILWF